MLHNNIGHWSLHLVPNVLLCHISCPACKAGTSAFVCSLQHVEVTGMEDSLNNWSYIPAKTTDKQLWQFVSLISAEITSHFLKVPLPCMIHSYMVFNTSSVSSIKNFTVERVLHVGQLPMLVYIKLKSCLSVWPSIMPLTHQTWHKMTHSLVV